MTRPTVTFSSDRNAVDAIMAARYTIGSRPLPQSIFVNKSTQAAYGAHFVEIANLQQAPLSYRRRTCAAQVAGSNDAGRRCYRPASLHYSLERSFSVKFCISSDFRFKALVR